MKSKKKGSILIEAVIAITITIITIIIVSRMYIVMKKTISRDSMNYRNRESLNAVCNEIKYNIDFESLRKSFKDGYIYIEYDEEFISKLLTNNLLELRSDYLKINKIEVVLLEDCSESLKILVKLHYNNEVLQGNIVKGRWMDYV